MNTFMQLPADSSGVNVLIALFGLAVGSFLNVVIHRLPGGWRTFFASIFSRCPRCGRVIHWYDNIPVLSYLLLRGRCRSCRQSISIQYPLVELSMAGIVYWLFQQYGANIYFYLYTIFFALMLAASVIDIRQRLIPDPLVIAGCLIGIGGSLLTPLPGWTNAVIGMVAGVLVPLVMLSAYERLRGNILIGGGDIKLLGMIGAFLGWQPLGEILFSSALIGGLVAVGFKLAGTSIRLPFAPFLFMGTLCALFASDVFDFIKV